MQDAWMTAYHQLELQLDRATFDTWLRGAELIRFEQDAFIVGVRSAVVRDMLQTRLYRVIARVLSDVAGHPVEARFEVHKSAHDGDDPDMPLFRLLAQQQANAAHDGGSVPAAAESLGSRVARPVPSLPDTMLNPRYTFGRFVAGGENQMAYAAARAAAERPAAAYNPLYLHGSVGLGKTHLLHAIAHELTARGLRALYVTSEAFTNDLVDSIRQKTMVMFRDKYRMVDALLIDDIQFIAGKESTQEEFFHTFNTLHQGGKQIVIASDRPPASLETLDDRLRSRFAGGLVMDIQPPSYETRVAILRNWCEDRGITLTDDVLLVLAERGKVNVRELEGMFNHIVASQQLAHQPASFIAAEELLDGYQRPRGRVSLYQVLTVTARLHGLTVEELTGKKRTARLNSARQIAMYMAREVTDASLPQIGDTFGGRAHSTVIHSYNKIEADLLVDPQLRALIFDLRRHLLEGV